MIELSNVEKHVTFKCEVVGYEFPDSPQDNWCLLKVTVKQDDKCFEAVDPALEANNLIAIYQWFECLSESRLPRYARLGFTEPCIRFEFLANKDGKVRIGVWLNAELKPDFRGEQSGPEDIDCRLVFELDSRDFEKVLNGIRKAIETYPIRRTNRTKQ